MFLGTFGRQARFNFHTPDADDPAGSGSPAANPATTAPVEQDPSAAAPTADPAAPAAAEEPADEAAEDDADPELTPDELRGELDRARRQSARYRTERNAARTRIAELEGQVAQQQAPPTADPAQAAEARATAAERRAQIAEAAAEAGVPAGLLTAQRELAAAETPEAISAALGKIKTFLAPASAGAHRPPADSSTAPTLQQQIADAEARRDVKASLRLKAQLGAST
jgi:hypothetical protein